MILDGYVNHENGYNDTCLNIKYSSDVHTVTFLPKTTYFCGHILDVILRISTLYPIQYLCHDVKHLYHNKHRSQNILRVIHDHNYIIILYRENHMYIADAMDDTFI